jgi:hypothetical protein
MTCHKANRSAALADEIRSRLGSPEVTRYLLSLPTFSTDLGLPERLRDLMEELQRAEAGRRRSGARRAD